MIGYDFLYPYKMYMLGNDRKKYEIGVNMRFLLHEFHASFAL